MEQKYRKVDGKMRWTLILLIIFTFQPVTAFSDELSDLNRKIEMLEGIIKELKSEVAELKEKQEEQDKEVEKVSEIAQTVEELKEIPSRIDNKLSKDINIGGHFKFYLLDRTDGERNGKNQNDNLSAGIHNVYLYVSKTLSDWLMVEIAPNLKVSAAATPSLGGDIKRSSSTSVDVDIDEAYMSLRLPWDMEVKAGAFYPLFSEEYARQSWWHEQYNGNNGLLKLQHWQSSGIEIYKNFDFELFSLPVYVYPYLNGEDRDRINAKRFTDNNANKQMLIHIAPEFYSFGSAIRLMGSLGYGKWDDDDDNDSWQYAVGADLNYKKINLSGEYLKRERENIPLADGGSEDGTDKGFYVRILYTLNPKWKVLAKYSDVDLFYPSLTMMKDRYETLSFAVNYWITESSTIIPQVEYCDAERSDGSESLNYFRYTLGWRTTF